MRALAASADVLLAHDTFTAGAARRELGPRIAPVTVVPHGSYVGVYPRRRARDAVRSELGIGCDDVMLLCFGELRGDSDVDVLLGAFATIAAPTLRLVVAGNVKVAAVAIAVGAAVARDSRIVYLPGFVPFEGVAELYGAADAAVLPRGNGGTSGSLILALSLRVPVIAADTPANREAGADWDSGWLFDPGDRGSLAAAIDNAARTSPDVWARKSDAAGAAAATLDWTANARLIARALAGAGG